MMHRAQPRAQDTSKTTVVLKGVAAVLEALDGQSDADLLAYIQNRTRASVTLHELGPVPGTQGA